METTGTGIWGAVQHASLPENMFIFGAAIIFEVLVIGLILKLTLPFFSAVFSAAGMGFHAAGDGIKSLLHRFIPKTNDENNDTPENIKQDVASYEDVASPESSTSAAQLSDQHDGVDVADEIQALTISKNAICYLRFYKKQGIATRTLKIDKTGKKTGKDSIKMSNLKFPDRWSGNWLELKQKLAAQTRVDCKAILHGGVEATKPTANKPSRTVTQRPNNPNKPITLDQVMDELNMMSSQAPYDAFDNMPPPADFPPQGEETVEKKEKPRAAIELVDKATMHENAAQKYRGRLVSHGFKKRALGEKEVRSYGCEFISLESGMPDTVWGNDLKRAISSVSAKEGDMVEIYFMGKKLLNDVDSKTGKRKTMNLWHVKVLHG